jgi:putative acyl-CoA dehydrogenase
VERLALALQGTLLRRHGDPAVADAFFAREGVAYGTLPRGLDLAAIVERHAPRV